MNRTPGHVLVPAHLLAILCGAVLGLLTFALSAALWRAGEHGAATFFGETILLASLACVAAVILFAEPARRRFARVPIGRPVPRAWWPAERDLLPLLAMAAGLPLVAGAGAAVALFR